MKSIDEQIACIRRELKFRYQLYNRQVRLGKMTQENAESEIASMKSVLETLKMVKEPRLSR